MPKHLFATLATALSAVVAIAAQAGELRAGVGKVDITSAPDEFPYKWREELPFVGIHDHVYARALVLDDGQRRVVLALVEVTTLPDSAGIVKAVAQEIGVPEANVLVAASHTHEVPLVFFHEQKTDAVHAREIERLTRGTLEAVREANAHLQPAQIAFGRGEAYVNINNGEQAGLKTWYDPHGPSDKTLDVVRVARPSGEPIALLVNYATHAEVMFRSVTRDGGYEVSGDLPGAVSRMLEAQSGGAPLVLYSPAAEADQLTLFKSHHPAGPLPEGDEGAAGWALLDAQARRVAESVMNVLASMPAGSALAQIETRVGSASCPGQHRRMDPTTGKISTEDEPPVTIPLSMIRINDIVLAGVGGDVASEIGQHFKAASPYKDSTMITMADGGLGYLLTDASYEHPGHGLMGSHMGPHCAERAIVDGLVQLIKSKP